MRSPEAQFTFPRFVATHAHRLRHSLGRIPAVPFYSPPPDLHAGPQPSVQLYAFPMQRVSSVRTHFLPLLPRSRRERKSKLVFSWSPGCTYNTQTLPRGISALSNYGNPSFFVCNVCYRFFFCFSSFLKVGIRARVSRYTWDAFVGSGALSARVL